MLIRKWIYSVTMKITESLHADKILVRKNVLISLMVFTLVSVGNFAYGQINEGSSPVDSPGNGDAAGDRSGFVDMVASELIATLSGILALGVSAMVAWLRNKGIPITTEQETMFRDIVSKRFEKLAKDSWTEMRAHPEKLDEYWKDLRSGRIPAEFQGRLRKEGYDFAMELKNNREFRDFGKKITEGAMQKLLKDLRTDLKNEYQKRMIDVLPKLASAAVDSAFDSNVKDLDTWGRKSLENLKPLLLSTEALDTEENLMILIKSEINKRIQARLTS